jgi:glycosyltransferase
MPAHPTFFLKKSVYEKHGGFDLSFRIAADYDFMLRVLGDESLSFSYLPEVITKMRVGGMSNRSLKNILQKSREDYRAIKKNGLPFPAKVLLAKNLSKIPQFLH